MKNFTKFLSLMLIVMVSLSVVEVYAEDSLFSDVYILGTIETELLEEEPVLFESTSENELLPTEARGCGFNSLNLLSNTKIAGYTVSMDLEYGGSGHNIHIK